MLRAIYLTLLMSALNCWVPPSHCISALLDCDSGESCVDSQCVSTPLVKDFSCTQVPEPLSNIAESAVSTFGQAVALDGKTLVVGAPLFQPTTMAVGRGYVFDLDNSSAAATVLDCNATMEAGHCGAAVAIRGDNAWLGAPNINFASGAVYRFTRSSGWSKQAPDLMSMMSYSGATFGGALSMDDQTLIVGVTNMQGKFYEGFTVNGASLGLAWRHDQTTTGAAPFFGQAVSMSSGWAVVSGQSQVIVRSVEMDSVPTALVRPPDEMFSNEAATPIAISNASLLVHTTGGGTGRAVWHYTRSGTTWSPAEALPLAGAPIVTALAMDGELAVIGAASGQGQAWVARFHDSVWTVVELSPKIGDKALSPTAQFGRSIAVSGQLVAVGAPGESGGRVFVFTCS